MIKTRQNRVIDFLPLILWAMLVFPAWRWVWAEWLGNDYYAHGLLIAPLTIYLFWRSWQREAKREPDNFGLILLLGALVTYGTMIYRQTFYGAAFASLLMAMGLIWTLFGLTTLRRVLSPILLLALAIPLPFVERATLPLSLWAGRMSGAMANFLRLGVAINGAAITLPNANLTIGAQCSGINSLIALFTLTALAAYLLNGIWWRKLGLILLAVPLAIFGNVLRIVNLIVVARYFGVNAAFDFYHNYAGAIFFIIAMLLLIPAARLLGCRTLRWDAL